MSLGLQGRALSPTVANKIDTDDGWNQALSTFFFVAERPNPSLFTSVQRPSLRRMMASVDTVGFPFGALTSCYVMLRVIIWYKSTYDDFCLGLATSTGDTTVLGGECVFGKRNSNAQVGAVTFS